MAESFISILNLDPQIAQQRKDLLHAIEQVLNRSDFIMGKDVGDFEQEVADYLGAKHAIGVNSGTDALVIALRAAGIGQGDQVITTPFSFFATAESISMVGAEPVFVDIDPKTLNINPAKVEEAITPRTKAIMPVHLFGLPAPMTPLKDVADQHRLMLIEDCAQSFGARYSGDCPQCKQECSNTTRSQLHNKQTGTIGLAGAYSFFPSKNLGAFGDAGLIATNDDQLAKEARKLRAHGAVKKYHNELLGYNSRLDTIQAAILRVKLPKIDEWNANRRQIAQRYNEAFNEIPQLECPPLTESHVFHQYTVQLHGLDRDSLQEKLKEQGVGTMVYYPVPQNRLPVYQGIASHCPESDAAAKRVLSLPIWPVMPEAAQERAIKIILKTLES